MRVEDRRSGLGFSKLLTCARPERDLRRRSYSRRPFATRDYAPSAQVELSYIYSTMVEVRTRLSSAIHAAIENAKYADISYLLIVFDKHGGRGRERLCA
jgi:hypothetical protein